MGWVLILLALIQFAGGLSLMVGNTYGKVIGIIGGSLGAIGALLSIGGAYPWWSLAIFAACASTSSTASSSTAAATTRWREEPELSPVEEAAPEDLAPRSATLGGERDDRQCSPGSGHPVIPAAATPPSAHL
jgi:hypothetical protein